MLFSFWEWIVHRTRVENSGTFVRMCCIIKCYMTLLPSQFTVYYLLLSYQIALSLYYVWTLKLTYELELSSVWLSETIGPPSYYVNALLSLTISPRDPCIFHSSSTITWGFCSVFCPFLEGAPKVHHVDCPKESRDGLSMSVSQSVCLSTSRVSSLDLCPVCYVNL